MYRTSDSDVQRTSDSDVDRTSDSDVQRNSDSDVDGTSDSDMEHPGSGLLLKLKLFSVIHLKFGWTKLVLFATQINDIVITHFKSGSKFEVL